MANIPRTRRAVSHRRQLADNLFQRPQHLLERRRAIPAHIDRAQRCVRRFNGLYQHIHQVFHVHEVTGLLAIAKHGNRHALLHALAEDADHPGIRRGRVLARAEDIEEAENHRLQAMLAAVEIKVVLTGQLVGRIGRQRRLGGLFVNRSALAVVAVHRRAGGEDHTLHAGLAHRFAHIQGADKIALVRADRIIHRRLHRGHRRQMNHRRRADRGTRHQLGVGHIAFQQFDTRVVQRQVAALAGGQVVQHAHAVTLGQQCIDQVRADKARTAGNQHTLTHCCGSSRQWP